MPQAPPETLFTLDQPIEEFIEWATGQEVRDPRHARALLREVRISEELIKCMAIYGLATAFAHARRGSLKGAQELLNRAFGLPDKAFKDEVRELGPKESAQFLYAELVNEAGWEPHLALAEVRRLAGPALAAAGLDLEAVLEEK